MTRSKKASGRVSPAPVAEPTYVRPKHRLRTFFVLFVAGLMILSVAGGVIALIVGG